MQKVGEVGPTETIATADCRRSGTNLGEVQQQADEHTPVPQFREEAVEVVRSYPFELVQQRTLEQIEDVHVQERIAKQNVHVPVPPAKEEIAEVVRFTPQERLPQRIVEHSVDAAVPPDEEEAVVPTTPQERGPERIASQIGDTPVHLDIADTAEVVSITPNERDQHFFVVQVMDFLVTLMKEEIAKALRPLPQEHIHDRVEEGNFNDLVPHFTKVVVEMLQDLLQEHFQDQVVEQMVSFFFLQVWPLVEGSVVFAAVSKMQESSSRLTCSRRRASQCTRPPFGVNSGFSVLFLCSS